MTPTVTPVEVEVSAGVTLVVDLHAASGAPDGRNGLPVVLLHGLSQQRRFWGPVVHRMRTRPIAAIDLRAHGDTDTPVGTDVSVHVCGEDVVRVLDALAWDEAVVVGHSWGAAVALAAAAAAPTRVAGLVLVDGGLFSPSQFPDRAAVRERLTPPRLGITSEQLWERVRAGGFGVRWTPELQEALTPTFVTGPDGLLETRIGLTRHLEVLDGLLDYDPRGDLDVVERVGLPTWAVVCEPAGGKDAPADDWAAVKSAGIADATRRTNCMVHRWAGAVHDVPLQWPALVAGLVDAMVETREGPAR